MIAPDERGRAAQWKARRVTGGARPCHDPQARAIAALEELHEPLRNLQTFGTRLAQRYHTAVDEEERYYVSQIQEATRRIQESVAAALVTSRARPLDLVELDVAARAAMVALLAPLTEAGAQVRLGPLPAVTGEYAAVYGLFERLLSLSLRARNPEVALLILIQGERERHRGGEVVHLLIEDNGMGIEYLPRESGQPESETASAQLALCRRLVERCGGTFDHASARNWGSFTHITLPAHPTGERE